MFLILEQGDAQRSSAGGQGWGSFQLEAVLKPRKCFFQRREMVREMRRCDGLDSRGQLSQGPSLSPLRSILMLLT